jgi:hypothetical protein
MVITGLVRSHLGSNLDIDKIIFSFRMFKSLNPKNEIVISTYLNEVPEPVLKYTDQVIINRDPGPDIFVTNRWIFTSKNDNHSFTNFTRFFQTNYYGIRACRNNLVLKARIEMLPCNLTLLAELIEEYQVAAVPNVATIGFFTEHYSGIFHSVDGDLGGIPGTIQISSKEVLEKLYFQSFKFWKLQKKLLIRKANRHVITGEQILGLNFLYLFVEFPLYSKLNKLNKYFRILSLKKSGFELFKYQGTFFIKTPLIIDAKIHRKVLIKLAIVFFKRYKHRLRRFKSHL